MNCPNKVADINLEGEHCKHLTSISGTLRQAPSVAIRLDMQPFHRAAKACISCQGLLQPSHVTVPEWPARRWQIYAQLNTNGAKALKHWTQHLRCLFVSKHALLLHMAELYHSLNWLQCLS